MRAFFRTTQRVAFAAALLGSSTFLVRTQSVVGQEPETPAPRTTAPADPNANPLPELPDTVVPGRVGPFPTLPLSDDVVVSPSNSPTNLNEVGSSITVISSEQIAAKQQQNLAEVLRGSTGLDVVRQGGPGGVTSVFLRGANSQQTKVLLDGIPVNDPSNASRLFDFSNLSVDNIERIEVLRGPQSVIYGSDAIGGVINVVTKRGQGPLTARVGVMGGTFGTSQETVSVSGGDDRKYYAVAGSYLNSNGISAASSRNGNTEADGYRNGTASGRFGLNPIDGWNVDYTFRWSDARAEVDDFSFITGLPIDNLIRANLSRTFFNRVQLQNSAWDGIIEQKVGFSLSDYNRKDTDSGPFSPPLFLGQTRLVDYQADVLLTENNTLTAGASYQQEDASSTFDPLASLNDKAVYLQDRVRLFDRWTTTVGVRWDNYNRAGPAETYRITSVYWLEETATSVHGTLGTGFRAPALAESLFAFGNPNLRPEQSKGWDAGVRQDFFDGAITLDATYFDNRLTDLIVFDFNTFSLENIGRARTSGVEVTGLCQLTQRILLNGNYTFTDAVNLETNTVLLRRPRHKAGIGMEFQLPDDRTTMGLQGLVVGQRLDTGNNILSRYSLLNFTCEHAITSNWNVLVRMDNLFNRRYEEVRGFGVPGITGFVGTNVTW